MYCLGRAFVLNHQKHNTTSNAVITNHYHFRDAPAAKKKRVAVNDGDQPSTSTFYEQNSD